MRVYYTPIFIQSNINGYSYMSIKMHIALFRTVPSFRSHYLVAVISQVNYVQNVKAWYIFTELYIKTSVTKFVLN